MRISFSRAGIAGAAAVAAMLATGLALAGDQSAPPQTAPLPLEQLFGGSFDLVDHLGQARSDKDFHGRYMLIYFGYTTCPSICPLNLQQMAEALELLGAQGGEVVPVFITVDPKRDTQMVVADYVAAFGPRFVGLTGSETQIQAVTKAYRVHRRKVLAPDSAPEDYLVDHASLTYLIGPDGRFRTLFAHGTPARTMAERIIKYVADGQS